MQEGKFEALGTTISVSVPLEYFETSMALVEAEAQRIEAKFSRFLLSSDLSRVNQNLDRWVTVDEEFIRLLKNFENLRSLTGDYLSLATTALLEHWGYDKNYALKSTAVQKSFIPWVLTIKDNQIRTNQPLDFGCFGKGYFLDQAQQRLRAKKVPNYVINAGGDLVCKHDARQTFYLEDPRVQNRFMGEIQLEKGFLCASAANRRQWGPFHHLIDISQLKPAADMQAVFIQSDESGFITDAISTAFFVAGFTKTPLLMTRIKSVYPSVSALIISANGRVWRTDNFTGCLYTA